MTRKPEQLRMYLLVRRDLEMTAGKLAAMAGHGFVDCAIRHANRSERFSEEFGEYQKAGQTKIVLGVEGINELVRLRDLASNKFLTTATIVDEGRTCFNGVHTVTVCAIGPCYADQLPEEITHLGLY